MVSLDSGSEVRYKLNEMGKLYAPVRQLLGPSGTILPIGDPGFGKPDATTFKTFGDQQVDFTWSEPWRAFDGHDALADSATFPYRFQGICPVIDFNGSNEEADSTNDSYWSRDDAAGEGFSICAWVKVNAIETNGSILSKYTSGGVGEWHFSIASSKLRLQLRDDSVPSQPARTSDSNLTTAQWRFVAVTYDGAGGSAAMNTVTLYDNGAVMASTAVNSGTYVAMEPTASLVAVGMQSGPAFAYLGAMAGGPLGPAFTHKELRADEIKQLYNLGRAALWL